MHYYIYYYLLPDQSIQYDMVEGENKLSITDALSSYANIPETVRADVRSKCQGIYVCDITTNSRALDAITDNLHDIERIVIQCGLKFDRLD